MDKHSAVANVEDFNGLFDRGELDKVPDDHASALLNMQHPQQSVAVREGTTIVQTCGSVNRIFVYKKTGETSRLLFLIAGSIYDSTNPTVPILTITGMTDFAALNLFNRAYISPHDGIEGLAGESVYVYDGTTCRVAAGIRPTGFTMTAAAGTGTKIDEGAHLFAICFETASGHLTRPGPESYVVFSAAGGAGATISNIIAGPTGTAARVLLGTKAIAEYSGNPDEYEFFIIPDGRVAGNSATPASITVDFYDADLVESADYLFDLLSTIPAGIGLAEYKGKMISWGEDGDSGLVRISTTGNPESFSEIDGFITTDTREVGGVKSCFVYRETLFINKSYQTYATSDNGSAPTSWQLLDIDGGVGSSILGVATVNESKKVTNDAAIIASHSGLWLFNGLFAYPQLSWKIDSLWLRINKQYFDKVQVVQDPVNTRIYILVPLDNATEPSHMILAEYCDGLSPQNIHFGLWQFPWKPTAIAAYIDASTLKPILYIGSSDNNIYKLDDTKTTDNTVTIPWYYQTAYFSATSGAIGHFNGIRLRGRGAGPITINLYGEDSITTVAPPTITITSAPGLEYARIFNFQNEKCSVKLSGTTSTSTLSLQRLVLYGKPLWITRPA
jgi:hypothetical protein